MKIIKKPLSQFVGKRWLEFNEELTIYFRRWAESFPKGSDDIAEPIRAGGYIDISDGYILNEKGRINTLLVHVEGYLDKTAIFAMDFDNLRELAAIIQDERKKA